MFQTTNQMESNQPKFGLWSAKTWVWSGKRHINQWKWGFTNRKVHWKQSHEGMARLGMQKRQLNRRVHVVIIGTAWNFRLPHPRFHTFRESFAAGQNASTAVNKPQTERIKSFYWDVRDFWGYDTHWSSQGYSSLGDAWLYVKVTQVTQWLYVKIITLMSDHWWKFPASH